jgi:hypothetical protein
MNHIKIKLMIASILFYALFSTTSVGAIRYDFTEQVDFRFPKPTSQLFSGYYVFDELTSVTLSSPAHPSPGYFVGTFDNPIIEIGFTFQGQTAVFNTCLSASCSEIKLESYPHEEYYSANATLLDSTGTRSGSFSLDTRDMGRGGLDIENIDIGGYSTAFGAEWGAFRINFETLDGQNLSSYGEAWDLVSAGPVSTVPEPTSFLLIGIGLAVLGFARKK